MSGNQQGQTGMPIPGRPGLVPLNYQSGAGGSATINTTIIRPSPGATTDVIIRPATGVDGQPGRTQIFRFPPTGDFQNVQVQSPRLVQASVPTGTPSPVQLPLGNGQGPGQSGPFLSPSKPPGSPCQSPYNFQSQRCPVAGLQLTNPGVAGLLLDDGIVTVDPFTSAVLKESMFGIQILPQGQVVTNSSLTSPWDILRDTEHIFIESANNGDFSDGSFTSPTKFNLMDSYGNRLFYAFENRKRSGGWCWTADTPLDMAIVDANGVEVMTLSGDTRRVTLRSSESGPCGYVQEQVTLCPSTSLSYDIKDKDGNLNFKLLPERGSRPTEFELYGNDMIRIGHVGKYWGHLPDSGVDMSHSYGISFPKDMNTEEKTLMLGAMVPIYWKYFGDRSRETRLARGAWCCLAIWILILLLVIFGISVLAAYIIRPSG